MRSRYKCFKVENPCFLTCTVVNWIPIFTSQQMFEIVVESLDFLRKEKTLSIHGYVILENHLHLIAASEELSKSMGRFKSYTARKIIDIASGVNNHCLLKQLKSEKKRFKIDRDYQFWQEGFHPQIIESESVFMQKLEYVHNNPVKRGYVDDPISWVYSSARNYAGGDGCVLEIDLMEL